MIRFSRLNFEDYMFGDDVEFFFLHSERIDGDEEDNKVGEIVYDIVFFLIQWK